MHLRSGIIKKSTTTPKMVVGSNGRGWLSHECAKNGFLPQFPDGFFDPVKWNRVFTRWSCHLFAMSIVKMQKLNEALEAFSIKAHN
jgi:hypothetical protein